MTRQEIKERLQEFIDAAKARKKELLAADIKDYSAIGYSTGVIAGLVVAVAFYETEEEK